MIYELRDKFQRRFGYPPKATYFETQLILREASRIVRKKCKISYPEYSSIHRKKVLATALRLLRKHHEPAIHS